MYSFSINQNTGRSTSWSAFFFSFCAAFFISLCWAFFFFCSDSRISLSTLDSFLNEGGCPAHLTAIGLSIVLLVVSPLDGAPPSSLPNCSLLLYSVLELIDG